MVDVVDSKTRSRMMSGIRGKNTKPEVLIRKALFARGFRYRLHGKDLPGKPDLVLPRYRAVIHIHGCFWHGHQINGSNCHLFKWPSSRTDFWQEKIGRNQQRDREVAALLQEAGWRQASVWECAIKGKKRLSVDHIADQITHWLVSDTEQLEITGKSA